MHDVLIAGFGIGGLTLALIPHRAGHLKHCRPVFADWYFDSLDMPAMSSRYKAVAGYSREALAR